MAWYKKIKIRLADKEFSLYIRTRDNWHCAYGFKCFRAENYQDAKGGLACSHFQKRRKESVRFDPDNCDATCAKCHNFIENEKDGQRTLEEWKLKQLGTHRYKVLLIRANQTVQKDDYLTRLYIKQLWTELKNF